MIVFRDSNLKKLSEYLVLQSNIFLYFWDRFSKLKRFFPFLDPLFFTFLADLSKRNVALFWEWLFNHFLVEILDLSFFTKSLPMKNYFFVCLFIWLSLSIWATKNSTGITIINFFFILCLFSFSFFCRTNRN